MFPQPKTSRIPRQILHPLEESLHADALHLLVVVPPPLREAIREARPLAGELVALEAEIDPLLLYAVLHRAGEKDALPLPARAARAFCEKFQELPKSVVVLEGGRKRRQPPGVLAEVRPQ